MNKKEKLLLIFSSVALIISLISLVGQFKLRGVQTFAKAPKPPTRQLATAATPVGSPLVQGPRTCADALEHDGPTLDHPPSGNDWSGMVGVLHDWHASCGVQLCGYLDQETAVAQANFRENSPHYTAAERARQQNWLNFLSEQYNSLGCNRGGSRDGQGTTYTGGAGDTCISNDPNVHSYFECKEAELRE